MALVLKDRVRVTSNSSGTGAFSLSGALMGYQDFSVIGNGNTTYYCITDASYGTWEVGIGTYNSSSLSRDTVLSSSNAGSLVNFAIGTLKDVFCTYPAERAVTQSVPVTYTADFTVAPGDTWIISNPAPYVTLDPNDFNILGVLSNGNLTYTWDWVGSFGVAYGTFGRSSGKYYFEVINTVAGGYGPAIYDNWAFNAGIAQTKNISNDTKVGTDADAWGFSNSNLTGLGTDSTIVSNSVVTELIGTSQVPEGGYLGVAVNFDAGKIWFNANGTWVYGGNPAVGTGPSFTFTPNVLSYPAVGAGSYSPYSSSTINFGASAFAGTIPAGFSAWGGAAATTTITLPAASDYPGRALTIQNYQDQTVVSAASNVVPIGGGAAGTAILDPVAGTWATLVSDGTNWVIMTAGVNNVLLLE